MSTQINSNLLQESLAPISPFYVSPLARRWLHRSLLMFGITIFVFIWFFTDNTSPTKFSAIIIIFAALLPSWMWGTGRVGGMPLYAVYSITYIWTYAMPLVTGHETVDRYTGEQHLAVAVKVAVSLMAGALVWALTLRKPTLPPKQYLSFSDRWGDAFFLLSVYGLFLLQVSVIAHWYAPTSRVMSMVRAAAFGLGSLGIFAFSFQLGRKEIPRVRRYFFFVAFIGLLFALAAGLFLQVALSIFLLFVVGYTISAKKPPFLALFIVIVTTFVLHHGKGEMRYKYWQENNTSLKTRLLPWDYPTWYLEWVQYGLEDIQYGVEDDGNELAKKAADANVFHRSSLVHMFLYLEQKVAEGSPYLNGRGYSYIPLAIIPRVFYPGKPPPHQGQYLLNDEFGMQTLSASGKRTTYIAWGLIAEAFGNFGTFGAIGISMFFGLGFGLIAKWAMFTPILSLRTLVAIVTTTTTFQTEWTAGVYAAGIFQAGVVIVAFSYATMKPRRDLYPKAVAIIAQLSSLSSNDSEQS